MSTLYAINGEIINSQEPLPIPVDFMTLLWENSNPGAEFAAQDITLASDDYDFLLLICRFSTTYDRELSFIVEKGKNEFINTGSTGSGGAIGIWRDFNRVNDTKYSVSNAYYAMGATAQTNNDTNLIPQRIYGFKKQVPMQSGGGGTKYDPETDMIYLWDGTQWVEWKTGALKHHYLYYQGDFYNNLTAFEAKAAKWYGNTQQLAVPIINSNSKSIQFVGGGSAANNAGTVFTKESIDLTDVKKIKINILDYSGSYVNYDSLFISTSNENGYTYAIPEVRLNTVIGGLELDVSSISGYYYIGFYINSTGDAHTIDTLELIY